MRKFAKISAVLAAMVLALAFVGCNSDDDDDDDVSGVGGSGSEKAYWISVEDEDGDTKEYAGSYIDFTSSTTAVEYDYYDESDVEDGKTDKAGYHESMKVTFTTSGSTMTMTDITMYKYDEGWKSYSLDDVKKNAEG